LEFFVLLNRRYSHPPDDVHLRVIRHIYLGQNVEVDYDPLAADPDYLVVGPIGKLSRLYEPILQTGSFRMILDGSRYQVYERVRAKQSRDESIKFYPQHAAKNSMPQEVILRIFNASRSKTLGASV
jgi:hypothetical protein